jgi:hypothetical protein
LIYKDKGEMDDPGNLMGIALLSILAKIYMGVLGKKLYDWIEKKGILSDFQIYFRKGRRTVDNIFIKGQ